MSIRLLLGFVLLSGFCGGTTGLCAAPPSDPQGLIRSTPMSAAMTIAEPAEDPATQDLVQARHARFEAATRALLAQLPQFASLKTGIDGRLPDSVYQYAHGNEKWGFSLALFHQYFGDNPDAELEPLALARQWWSPALLALTLQQQELDLDDEERAALLLQLLEDPDFGRQSSLARSWIRPFYVQLASRPFPRPANGQSMPHDAYGMVLAHLAAISVDFERMTALDVAGSVCDFDPEAQAPSTTCVRIRERMRGWNRGRLLFDLQKSSRA